VTDAHVRYRLVVEARAQARTVAATAITLGAECGGNLRCGLAKHRVAGTKELPLRVSTRTAAERLGLTDVLFFALFGIALHPLLVGFGLTKLFAQYLHVVPDSGYCHFLPAKAPPPPPHGDPVSAFQQAPPAPPVQQGAPPAATATAVAQQSAAPAPVAPAASAAGPAWDHVVQAGSYPAWGFMEQEARQLMADRGVPTDLVARGTRDAGEKRARPSDTRPPRAASVAQ